jgi:hypothetical protein
LDALFAAPAEAALPAAAVTDCAAALGFEEIVMAILVR